MKKWFERKWEKIKMWEKYNKKVTNRGERHQGSWMPFLGHYLTPSGLQQRKPQMEKNLTGCHKCLRTPVPEDPRGHLGSWHPATQEEMGIQRGQVWSGDIQQVCLELFRSQAPGNWLPDHPIHHCTTPQTPLLPTLPGISGSLQIGGQTQQGLWALLERKTETSRVRMKDDGSSGLPLSSCSLSHTHTHTHTHNHVSGKKLMTPGLFIVLLL